MILDALGRYLLGGEEPDEDTLAQWAAMMLVGPWSGSLIGKIALGSAVNITIDLMRDGRVKFFHGPSFDIPAESMLQVIPMVMEGAYKYANGEDTKVVQEILGMFPVYRQIIKPRFVDEEED
jgi:hypothetical protein